MQVPGTRPAVAMVPGGGRPGGHGRSVTGSPSVAVVDPHPVTRVALPLVLPELGWTGAAATAGELLAARPAADVVLLALHADGATAAPGPAWAGTVGTLVEAGYPVCVSTGERRASVLRGCLAAGALALAHPTDSLDVLRAALRSAAAGRRLVSATLAGPVDPGRLGPDRPSLTERQLDVLSARARGEKFESIARRLFISRKVAEEHWAAVARKYAPFLRDHSPADLERLLGLEPAEPLAATARIGTPAPDGTATSGGALRDGATTSGSALRAGAGRAGATWGGGPAAGTARPRADRLAG